MNTDLQKRLEEAAEKYALSLQLPSIERTYYATRDDFKAGAEYGYKEAIKEAKEWIREHLAICVNTLTLSQFEEDMNKLLEEKK